jgi:hypothetical protein
MEKIEKEIMWVLLLTWGTCEETKESK